MLLHYPEIAPLSTGIDNPIGLIPREIKTILCSNGMIQTEGGRYREKTSKNLLELILLSLNNQL